MGAFHDGHLSLIRRARAECDVVVVSLFVNPTQFNDPSDLSAYPREEQRDAALAARARRRLPVLPSAGRDLSRRVSRRPCRSPASPTARGRPPGRAHFDGVATVVTKLFNIVGPDVAYFGQKDAQQAIVDQAPGARPRHSGTDRGLPDRPRAGWARDVQPQRPPLARRTGARDGSSARAERRRKRWWPPASATP